MLGSIRLGVKHLSPISRSTTLRTVLTLPNLLMYANQWHAISLCRNYCTLSSVSFSLPRFAAVQRQEKAKSQRATRTMHRPASRQITRVAHARETENPDGVAGGNVATATNMIPPSAEEGVRSSVGGPARYEEFGDLAGDDARRIPSRAVGARGAGTSGEDDAKARLLRSKWTMFAAGKLISTAAVISIISTLRVCVHEYGSNGDDDFGVLWLAEEETSHNAASWRHGVLLYPLIFGLCVEWFFFFLLSITYRSPLDINSLHKIPAGDLKHCGVSVIVHFVAPLSWTVIYFAGGTESLYHGYSNSCDEKVWQTVFLVCSGHFMIVIGLGTLLVSVLILPFACVSPINCFNQRWASFRRIVQSRILSNGVCFDLFWKLQGPVWLYRTGGLGAAAAIAVGVTSIFGVVLSAFGSFAPDMGEMVVEPPI